MAVKDKPLSKREVAKKRVDDRLLAKVRRERETIDAAKLTIAAARKRRDAAIIKLADRGVSERSIAVVAGMSGPRVNQIYHGTYAPGSNGR